MNLLLHDTKNTLALPEKTFGLPGPGWQTEKFSLVGPKHGRGAKLSLAAVGFHHLNDILFTEEFDANLFQQFAGPTRE